MNIKVEQEDIDNGEPRSENGCPIALERQVPACTAAEMPIRKLGFNAHAAISNINKLRIRRWITPLAEKLGPDCGDYHNTRITVATRVPYNGRGRCKIMPEVRMPTPNSDKSYTIYSLVCEPDSTKF